VIAWLLAVALAAPIDVNTASVEELSSLGGLGLEGARAIVAFRDRHGPFARLEDLDAVSGIGPATLENLRPHVIVASEAPDGAVVDVPDAVDVNHASADDLAALPGLGRHAAEEIVRDRATNGPYATCADLARVEGVGPATLAAIAERCVARREPERP
jgi:competence ComEA-like helix-hairpin-helix protein